MCSQIPEQVNVIVVAPTFKMSAAQILFADIPFVILGQFLILESFEKPDEGDTRCSCLCLHLFQPHQEIAQALAKIFVILVESRSWRDRNLKFGPTFRLIPRIWIIRNN